MRTNPPVSTRRIGRVMAVVLTLVLAWAGMASAAVNEWTWVSGADTPNAAGSYGVKGIPAASNVPPALSYPATWVDQDGNFWMFGGATNGGMPSNALWRWDGENWTWMSGSSTVGQTGDYGEKGVPASTNVPGARIGAAMWVDHSGNLWLFGGWVYLSGKYLNDLWRWDIALGQWTWMSGSNTYDQPGVYGDLGIPHANNVPGARSDPAFWTDPDGNFWLFAGGGYLEGVGYGPYQDLWRWDGSQWTWMHGPDTFATAGMYGTKNVPAAANIPGARGMTTAWVDAAGDFWLFGGLGYASVSSAGRGNLNDLWRWDGENWTWVSGSDNLNQSGVYGVKNVPAAGNVPGARDTAVGWVDTSGNFWMFGGLCCTNPTTPQPPYRYDDLWKWDGTNWTWVGGSDLPDQSGVYGTKGIPAASNIPGARFASGAFTDLDYNFWLFGGVGLDAIGTPVALNDLWMFDTPVPAVSLSASSHGFGTQVVSTTSSPFSVTVTNSGSADLHVGTLAPSGDFAVSNSTCGAAVTPGNTCTFDITFTPTAEGARWGSVSIPSDASGSPHTINLAGTGVTAGSGATITVNTNGDTTSGSDGLCTLREAIIAANANTASGFVSGECAAGSSVNADTIDFNIPGSGVQTISLSTELPAITAPVTIDGTTQPGASCAAWPPTLLIELRGPGWSGWPGTPVPPPAGPPMTGLSLGGSGSAVRGLVISRFGNGILLGSGPNTVTCNYIGTDADGAVAQPNLGGVSIQTLSTNSVIGGTSATDRNLISGNIWDGVSISGTNTAVRGNYIGTDATGMAAIGNASASGTNGITILGSSNTIGGSEPGAGNVISGNLGGVGILTGSGNVIQGNFIGLNKDGTAALPNTQLGIVAQPHGSGTANQILDNVISGNAMFGVWIGVISGTPNPPNTDNTVVSGNRIGTNALGTAGVPNGTDAQQDGGVMLNGVAGTQLTNNLIAYHNNTDDNGVWVLLSTLGTSDNNCFYGNTTGVRFGSNGSGTLDMTSNWWGDVSGPTIASNPGGTGDPIVEYMGTVTYVPFLTTPPPACAAGISISPASPYDFGDVLVGSSATQTFTVENTGGIGLTLSGISVTGDGFADAGSGTCTASTALLPDGTCTIDISFSPSAVGAASGSLDVTSDAASGSGSVALSGTGVLTPPSTVTPPVLKSPTDGAAVYKTPVNLKWKAVKNALRYHIRLDNLTTSTNIADEDVTTAYFTTPSLPFGTYAWKVKVETADGWSEYSLPFTFDVTLNKTPKKNAQVTTHLPKFSWQAVKGAERYHLQVLGSLADCTAASPDPVFQAGADSAKYVMKSPDEPLDFGTYYWRVRVDLPAAGDYTPCWAFTLSSLKSPKNGSASTSLLPRFSWAGNKEATGYQITVTRVDDERNPLEVRIDHQLVTKPTYPATTGDGFSFGRYEWHIVEVDSAFSEATPNFTLFITNMSKPANNTFTLNGKVAFIWKKVTGASTYKLEVSEDPDFGALAFPTTEGSALKFTVSSLPRGVYYWRVVVDGTPMPAWTLTVGP